MPFSAHMHSVLCCQAMPVSQVLQAAVLKAAHALIWVAVCSHLPEHEGSKEFVCRW